MNETTINFKGRDYIRDMEMLGDVEKVKWYRYGESLEIFDTDLCLRLEETYESGICKSLLPILPLI